jgi:hypothetical protein
MARRKTPFTTRPLTSHALEAGNGTNRLVDDLVAVEPELPSVVVVARFDEDDPEVPLVMPMVVGLPSLSLFEVGRRGAGGVWYEGDVWLFLLLPTCYEISLCLCKSDGRCRCVCV